MDCCYCQRAHTHTPLQTYATAAAKIGEERAARYAEWAQRPDARKILDVLNARRIKRGAQRIRPPVSLRKRMPPTAYTL